MDKPIFDFDRVPGEPFRPPDATWVRTDGEDGRFVIEVLTPAGDEAIWDHRGFESLEEVDSWLEMTSAA